MTETDDSCITVEEMNRRRDEGYTPFTSIYTNSSGETVRADNRGVLFYADDRWDETEAAHAVLDWAATAADLAFIRDSARWLVRTTDKTRWKYVTDSAAYAAKIVRDAAAAAWLRVYTVEPYYPYKNQRGGLSWPNWLRQHSEGIGRHIVSLLRGGAHDGFLSYALADLTEDPDVIRCAGRLIVIPGMVDETDEEWQPWLRTANYAPVADVETPLWHALLSAVLPDEVEREHALSALSHGFHGHTTKSVPFWRSETGYGKSLVLSLVADLLGDYARTVPAKTLFGQFSDPQRAAVELAGVRLVLVDEGLGNFRSDETFKALTSGRPDLNSRRLYSESEIVTATHTIALAVNPEQDPNYADPAIRSRLVPAQPDGDPDRIAELAARINPASEEWQREAPGVMAQMLNRAAAALADINGYGTVRDLPQRGRDLLYAGADMAALASPVNMWLSSGAAEIDLGAATSSRDLYASYCNWCHARRIAPEKSHVFGRVLTREGAAYTKRTKEGRFWGVRLAIEE